MVLLLYLYFFFFFFEEYVFWHLYFCIIIFNAYLYSIVECNLFLLCFFLLSLLYDSSSVLPLLLPMLFMLSLIYNSSFSCMDFHLLYCLYVFLMAFHRFCLVLFILKMVFCILLQAIYLKTFGCSHNQVNFPSQLLRNTLLVVGTFMWCWK